MVQRGDVDRAAEMTMLFVEKAAGSKDGREAADWALAAKNMAATVHSLAGARATQSRGA